MPIRLSADDNETILQTKGEFLAPLSEAVIQFLA